MDDLIAVLEAAQEGSRELDRLVYNARCRNSPISAEELAADDRLEQFIANYTTSLDAALTLVPEGWFWQVGQTSSFKVWARVYRTHPDFEDGDAFSFKREPWQPDSTPAVALCIAALKAKQAANRL